MIILSSIYIGLEACKSEWKTTSGAIRYVSPYYVFLSFSKMQMILRNRIQLRSADKLRFVEETSKQLAESPTGPCILLALSEELQTLAVRYYDL